MIRKFLQAVKNLFLQLVKNSDENLPVSCDFPGKKTEEKPGSACLFL